MVYHAPEKKCECRGHQEYKGGSHHHPGYIGAIVFTQVKLAREGTNKAAMETAIRTIKGAADLIV